MRRVAICPKCESRKFVSERTVEAWCQHAVGWEKGQIIPKDESEVLETVPCKIIEVKE